MLNNRSMPASAVIPELAYPDVSRAAEWLCDAFGFTVRLRIANHRIQLIHGDGAMVLTTQPADRTGVAGTAALPSMMIRVDDVDAHHKQTVARGARVLREPETHPYGERQYTAIDFAGRTWTFSQTVADVDPEDWGGVPG
jgi:uncharacterized glyoxalase superfamily protein PhnB